MTLVHYFDANLMHDVLSGKAVTGCVHFANKTPIMWYSKKQATSETATYGSEFIAGRTRIEQIVDLRNTIRYLGVPINEISCVFGDNQSMIDSATFPYARLQKRHNILSFLFVKEHDCCRIHCNASSDFYKQCCRHPYQALEPWICLQYIETYFPPHWQYCITL